MPRILVLTEPVPKPDDGVMLDEQLAASDLASSHFATQLVERIGWALADAESSEHHRLGPLSRAQPQTPSPALARP
jgi:hypothetical protein